MEAQDIEIDGITLAESDRWIISAALGMIRDELRDTLPGSPLLLRISQLREAFSTGAIRKEAPAHVIIDDAEFLNFMASLPKAETWLLRWESSAANAEVFDLVAEITTGDRTLQFDIAGVLLGTGSFQHLRAADAAFVKAVEERVSREAPCTAIQLHREIIEIPVPWDVIVNDRDVPSDVEAYLADITEGDRQMDYGIRATLVDIHSNSDLASAEFAGVWAEVFATQEDLDSLRPVVNGYARDLRRSGGSVLA